MSEQNITGKIPGLTGTDNNINISDSSTAALIKHSKIGVNFQDKFKSPKQEIISTGQIKINSSLNHEKFNKLKGISTDHETPEKVPDFHGQVTVKYEQLQEKNKQYSKINDNQFNKLKISTHTEESSDWGEHKGFIAEAENKLNKQKENPEKEEILKAIKEIEEIENHLFKINKNNPKLKLKLNQMKTSLKFLIPDFVKKDERKPIISLTENNSMISEITVSDGPTKFVTSKPKSKTKPSINNFKISSNKPSGQNQGKLKSASTDSFSSTRFNIASAALGSGSSERGDFIADSLRSKVNSTQENHESEKSLQGTNSNETNIIPNPENQGNLVPEIISDETVLNSIKEGNKPKDLKIK
jgi:hypothetical protein